jgi:aldehyde:ferredoxin oxidoreductase
MGQILRVNLKTSGVTKESTDIDKAKKFIGSRGLGVKYLYDEVDPKVDPLSPENKIFIAPGPLTGSHMPTGGRYMVMTKSPLTDGVAYANSGGFWGVEFKRTGYDMIILEDKADKPVYLYINESGDVEIKDASAVWGKTVTDTTKALQDVHGEKSRVLCIGPAGENLSYISAIMNEIDRAAGRGGVGAVMGSKNIKAIVVKGSGNYQYADEAKAKDIAADKRKLLAAHPVAGTGLPTYGTAILVNIINENGVLPLNNFQESYSERAEEISGETLKEKYVVGASACVR